MMDESSGDYDSPSGILYPMDTTIVTTITRSVTTIIVLPSPTQLLPSPDTDNDDSNNNDDSIDGLILNGLLEAKDWVIGNPIVAGLAGAVLVLSILLLCMCYLWLCKRRKHILYEVVEFDDEEEGNIGATDERRRRRTDGGSEIHSNPCTTQDDDIDTHIIGINDSEHTTSIIVEDSNGVPNGTVQHMNRSNDDKLSRQLVAELKEVQTSRANTNNHTEANININDRSSFSNNNSDSSDSSDPSDPSDSSDSSDPSTSTVQETTLVTNEVENQQQQPMKKKEEEEEQEDVLGHGGKETVVTSNDGCEDQINHYEEIPYLDQMTIDWPSDLTNALNITNDHSGSLNLSDISDIA